MAETITIPSPSVFLNHTTPPSTTSTAAPTERNAGADKGLQSKKRKKSVKPETKHVGKVDKTADSAIEKRKQSKSRNGTSSVWRNVMHTG